MGISVKVVKFKEYVFEIKKKMDLIELVDVF